MNPQKIIETPILFIGSLLRDHLFLTLFGIIGIIILVIWLKNKMQGPKSQGAEE